MELSRPKVKKLTYFFQKNFSDISGGNFQSPENKKKSALKKLLFSSKKKSYSHFGITVDHAGK